MRSKHIGVLSAAAVSTIVAVAVLGGLASLSSADSGGPTVVLSSTEGSSTSAASIPVTATFSEAVNGLASANVTATNATVGTISGSGTTYTFNLTPTAAGTVTVMIGANMASSTASSTGNQASNTLNFSYAPAATSTGTTTAFLSLSDYSGPPGMSINAIGTNFAASEHVSITFGSTTAMATADASGNFTQAMTVPSLPVGSATITATGSTSGRMATNSFFVEPATTTGTSTPSVPVISNISMTSMGTSSETIMWNTDIAASSQVFYGTSASYGSMSTLDSTATTSHSVTLTGLSEATLYHFQVQSGGTGGMASSTDMIFMTGSTASTTPLLVTGTDNVQTNATADGTFANGWEWILHLVVPTVENNFTMKFGDFTNTSNASTTFAAAHNIRIWSPQSSNASTVASAMVETGNGYSADMMLNGDTSTTTPGRQIDVYIQAAVPAGTPTGTYTTTFGAESTTTPF